MSSSARRGGPDGSDPLAPNGQGECARLEDQEFGFGAPAVRVGIMNRRGEGILVFNTFGGCNQPPRYFAVDGTVGGRPVTTPWSNCTLDWPRCEALMGGDDSCLACNTLHAPIYLAPGGRLETSWIPRVLAEATLPARCSGGAMEQKCFVAIPVGAGAYEFTARGTLASSCDYDGCTPDASGSCLATNGEYCAQDLVAVASYDGRCDAVEIVFDEP